MRHKRSRIIATGTFLLVLVFLSGCTSWSDTAKDFQSDTEGLNRTITIYSKTGEVLKQYKGKKIRTQVDESGQLKINIDGKRLQVLNADVIVEEDGVEKYEISPKK